MPTLTLAASEASDTASFATEDEGRMAGLHRAIAAKEREVSAAEAELASLITEDAKLVTTINERRALASALEPLAANFEDLADWHAAIRKHRADLAALDHALPPIEQQRNRMVMQQIPAVKRRIAELRFDLAQAEFDAARAEHFIAQKHANEMLARVGRLQRSLAAAGEAVRASKDAR